MSEEDDSSDDSSDDSWGLWRCSVCERDVPEDVETEPHLRCDDCDSRMCQDCYICCDCVNGCVCWPVAIACRDSVCGGETMCDPCGERCLSSCPICTCGPYIRCGDYEGDNRYRNVGDNGLPDCCCYHLHVELCERASEAAQRRRDVARALGIRPDGSQSTGTVGGPINLTPSDVMRHIYLLWQRSEQGRGGGGSSGERMSLLTF